MHTWGVHVRHGCCSCRAFETHLVPVHICTCVHADGATLCMRPAPARCPIDVFFLLHAVNHHASCTELHEEPARDGARDHA